MYYSKSFLETDLKQSPWMNFEIPAPIQKGLGEPVEGNCQNNFVIHLEEPMENSDEEPDQPVDDEFNLESWINLYIDRGPNELPGETDDKPDENINGNSNLKDDSQIQRLISMKC